LAEIQRGKELKKVEDVQDMKAPEIDSQEGQTMIQRLAQVMVVRRAAVADDDDEEDDNDEWSD